MRKWKYAVSAAPQAPDTAPILLTGDICDCIKKASELGYDAIEYHTRENTQFDYEKICRCMDEYSCRISMIVTGRMFTEGGYSLTDNDDEKRKYAIKGMLSYIDMASKLGAGLVLGWAKGKISAVGSREEYFRRLDEAFSVIDDYAAEKKVDVVIEVINHYEVDAFTTAQEIYEYLSQRNYKAIFSHLDIYHMQFEETNYRKAIVINRDYLRYFHLADSTRWYPGSGYINFKEVLRALDEIGYSGYLSVECQGHGDNCAAAAAALANMKLLEQNCG